MSTVLMKSGDLYFSTSAEGCSVILPAEKQVWLNDQIVQMMNDIIELKKGGAGKPGPAGKNGRPVEMRVALCPPDAEDIPINYAMEWRIKPDVGEIEPAWQVCFLMKDLVGPEGPQGIPGDKGEKGDPGKDGTSIKFKGTVDTVMHLLDLTNLDIGDGFLVTEKNSLYVLRAQPPAYLGSWADMGKIMGPKGEKGDPGPKGDRGKQGEMGPAGVVSMVVIQWMVNTATSIAINAAMTEVTTMINDAVNDAVNAAVAELENVITDTVKDAVEDAVKDLKGEKGDKGDDGEKGEDGKSIRMVGKYDTLTQFMTKWPATPDNVGVGALIGKDGEEKILWAITMTPSIGALPPHYTYEEMGDIRGPKGEDASWDISVRDKDFVETKHITVESDLGSVAGMYIQETDSILVEGLSGSQASPKQVGFRMRMKYPIPRLYKDGEQPGPSTKDKVLGNDGEKLMWVDGGGGGSKAQDEILLKAQGGARIWALTIDNQGRLHQDLSMETTDTEMLKLKSPNGQQWGIIIDRNGKLIVSEVV